MPLISGINVRDVQLVNLENEPAITVGFNPNLPTLIDLTATADDGFSFGSSIINDGNLRNNRIVLREFSKHLDQPIWLRVIVHHPRLTNFDFKVYLHQGASHLTEFAEEGSLSNSTYFYEGFILRREIP